MSSKTYYVYIMASDTGVLYIGFTGSIQSRAWQHKQDLIVGFTKKYKCHKLVYYEDTTDVRSAIEREKQLKRWTRFKKMQLIQRFNPQWQDLAERLKPDPSIPSDSTQDDRMEKGIKYE